MNVKFEDTDYVKWIPLITVLLLTIVLAFFNTDFISIYNVKSLFTQAAVLVVLATGMTFVILTAGIDLSIGAMVSCSGVIVAVTLPQLGYFSYLLGIIFGLLAGFFNGVVVAKGKIPSFIVTLGSGGIWLSMSYVFSKGRPVPVPTAYTHYRSWIVNETLGVPNVILIAFILVITAIFILRKTVFGRYIYAIGNGEKAAILSGINVEKVRIKLFMLNGLFASLGGIMLFGRLAAGTPSVGDSYMLPTIAAVIVGGTALTGGYGGITRSVLGAFIITLLNNGMNVIGVDAFAQQIVLGAILIISVALNLDRDKIPVLK